MAAMGKKKESSISIHLNLPAAIVGDDAAADAADHAANGEDGHRHRPDERHHRLRHELASTRPVHVRDEVLQNLVRKREEGRNSEDNKKLLLCCSNNQRNTAKQQ